MNSHPLHSLAVQTTCKRCLKQQTKLDGTMSRLKLVMKELNESLSRLKNEEKTEGEEVLPDIDEGLQEPASPVKKNNEQSLCSAIFVIPVTLTSNQGWRKIRP